MAKATKLPSGAWRIQLYAGKDENGKAIRESITAPTKKEVEELARQRELQLQHGAAKDRSLTLGEAIDQYIDSRDSVLSPRTVLEYRSIRSNHCQAIMPMEVCKLTENALQKAINAEAKTHSPKTVRNILGLITAAIHAVDKTIVFDINLPQKEHREMEIPTEGQLTELMERAKPTVLYIPILLAATAGLRRSEIAALDYSKDIDFERCEVAVCKAKVQNEDKEWVLKQPKTTTSNRKVKIPQWVADIIKEAADQGLQPPGADYISNGFHKLCVKLRIKNIRFHDLRHYYASTLLALGVPDKYAMARMGHSTTTMLKNVYQHRMKDKDKELDATIEAHFDQMKPSH